MHFDFLGKQQIFPVIKTKVCKTHPFANDNKKTWSYKYSSHLTNGWLIEEAFVEWSLTRNRVTS